MTNAKRFLVNQDAIRRGKRRRVEETNLPALSRGSSFFFLFFFFKGVGSDEHRKVAAKQITEGGESRVRHGAFEYKQVPLTFAPELANVFAVGYSTLIPPMPNER